MTSKTDAETIREDPWWVIEFEKWCPNCGGEQYIDDARARGRNEVQSFCPVCRSMREHLRNLLHRVKELERALRTIRNERKPQVCEGYELCTHEGCRASYEAFAIARAALATSPSENQEPRP